MMIDLLSRLVVLKRALFNGYLKILNKFPINTKRIKIKRKKKLSKNNNINLKLNKKKRKKRVKMDNFNSIKTTEINL